MVENSTQLKLWREAKALHDLREVIEPKVARSVKMIYDVLVEMESRADKHAWTNSDTSLKDQPKDESPTA